MSYMSKGTYPTSTRILAALAVAASSLLVSACGQSSPPEADSKAQPAPAAQAPAQQATAPAQVPAPAVTATPAPVAAAPLIKSDKLVIQGFASPVPAAWTPSQPSSTMRVAQFALPPAAGVAAGEVAVFFFPTGQGGSNEANIGRWTSEFSSADGKPVAPKISTSKSGDTELTLVELQGTYARGVGMGATGEAKPDQSLVVAIVKISIGQITLQMYGPSKTVSAQRDNFLKLAKGFRPA